MPSSPQPAWELNKGTPRPSGPKPKPTGNQGVTDPSVRVSGPQLTDPSKRVSGG